MASGHGCDICKPAIASILASRAGMSLCCEPAQAPLQDTNDYFLANIQRDGLVFGDTADPGRGDHT